MTSTDQTYTVRTQLDDLRCLIEEYENAYGDMWYSGNPKRVMGKTIVMSLQEELAVDKQYLERIKTVLINALMSTKDQIARNETA